MTIDETITYQLPTHWLPALINDDETGLEPKDAKQLYYFSRGEVGGMRKDHFQLLCWEVVEGEPSFMKYHDGHPYGCLACDCLEVKAHFQKLADHHNTTTTPSGKSYGVPPIHTIRQRTVRKL